MKDDIKNMTEEQRAALIDRYVHRVEPFDIERELMHNPKFHPDVKGFKYGAAFTKPIIRARWEVRRDDTDDGEDEVIVVSEDDVAYLDDFIVTMMHGLQMAARCRRAVTRATLMAALRDTGVDIRDEKAIRDSKAEAHKKDVREILKGITQEEANAAEDDEFGEKFKSELPASLDGNPGLLTPASHSFLQRVCYQSVINVSTLHSYLLQDDEYDSTTLKTFIQLGEAISFVNKRLLHLLYMYHEKYGEYGFDEVMQDWYEHQCNRDETIPDDWYDDAIIPAEDPTDGYEADLKRLRVYELSPYSHVKDAARADGALSACIANVEWVKNEDGTYHLDVPDAAIRRAVALRYVAAEYSKEYWSYLVINDEETHKRMGAEVRRFYSRYHGIDMKVIKREYEDVQELMRLSRRFIAAARINDIGHVEEGPDELQNCVVEAANALNDAFVTWNTFANWSEIHADAVRDYRAAVHHAEMEELLKEIDFLKFMQIHSYQLQYAVAEATNPWAVSEEVTKALHETILPDMLEDLSTTEDVRWQMEDLKEQDSEDSDENEESNEEEDTTEEETK